MLENLPLDIPLEDAVDAAMSYLSVRVPRINGWLDVLTNPLADMKIHHLYNFSDNKDGFINFLVSRQVLFLPDFLSKIIQLYGGINGNDYTLNLILLQQGMHGFLGVFMRLCEVRVALNFWIIFNPYAQPWVLLTTATEWYTESLSGMFPVFFGIDYTATLMIGVLVQIREYVESLVFTMPYLPSEGREEIIGSHKVYIFEGLPKLWYENGIPEQVREEWYNQYPFITEFFIKNYSNSGINFVPTKEFEEFYKNNPYQSLMNLNEFSSNTICHMNSLLDSDLLANHLSDISNKILLHL